MIEVGQKKEAFSGHDEQVCQALPKDGNGFEDIHKDLTGKKALLITF